MAENPPQGDSASALNGPEAEQPPDEFRGPPNEAPDEPLWTPLQFGIRILLILTAVWAVLLGIGRLIGIEATYSIVVLGLFVWLFYGLARLIGSAYRQPAAPAREPEHDCDEVGSEPFTPYPQGGAGGDGPRAASPSERADS